MVWLASLALSDGRRAGVSAVIGVGLGLAVMGALAAVGLGAALSASPVLYQTLRWAGVAYLLWLAWQGWRGAAQSDESSLAGAGHLRYFWRGFVTNVLNPKALVFYVAVLPAFLSAADGVVANLVLGAIYVFVATAIHGAIVLAASAARQILAKGVQMTKLRRALALMLVGVALWLAVKT